MENKVKQTALRWLNDELNKKYGIELSADSEVFNKALQMEREQIEKAVIYGMAEEVRERYSDKKLHLKPKGSENQYYTDTYGE